MILNDNERQGLADLATMPAYLKLMAILAEYEQGVLSDMAVALDDKTVLFNARFYQFLSTMRGVLQSAPQSISEELERFRQMSAEVDPQLDPSQTWQQRFGDPNDMFGRNY